MAGVVVAGPDLVPSVSHPWPPLAAHQRPQGHDDKPPDAPGPSAAPRQNGNEDGSHHWDGRAQEGTRQSGEKGFSHDRFLLNRVNNVDSAGF